MRIRIKDETINLTNIRIEKKQQEYNEKIAKADTEARLLQQELEKASKNVKVRNIKPLLAQKFLGDANYKLRE